MRESAHASILPRVPDNNKEFAVSLSMGYILYVLIPLDKSLNALK